MSYVDCRDHLHSILSSVADIKWVFKTPPGNIVDLPCYVMYGSRGNSEFVFGGGAMPQQNHTERCVLLLSDAKLEVATERTWEIRDATILALSNQGALGGYGFITGVSWGPPSAYTYGGRDYSGFELLVSFIANPV